MIKKPQDNNYCGVEESKIKSAKPKVNLEMLKRYTYYQKERTEIYRKKEILGEMSPWSSDPIFTNFKWTMTKRWLDRESKNLNNGILFREDISLENKILNSLAFRLINKFKCFDLLPDKYIDFSKEYSEKDWQQIKEIFIKSGEDSFFTSAYMISGTLRAIKIKVLGDQKADAPKDALESLIQIFKFVHLIKEEVLEISRGDNPDKMVKDLFNLYGVGKFIAYQVFSDWTYIKEFPFSDNSCAECGPGTTRGLEHFFEDFGGLSHKELVYWVRDNIESLCEENNIEWDLNSWFDFLPEESRYWGLQDITNSFCEFDKSTRIWTPELRDLNAKRVRKFDGKGTPKLSEW